MDKDSRQTDRYCQKRLVVVFLYSKNNKNVHCLIQTANFKRFLLNLKKKNESCGKYFPWSIQNWSLITRDFHSLVKAKQFKFTPSF